MIVSIFRGVLCIACLGISRSLYIVGYAFDRLGDFFDDQLPPPAA